LHLAKGWDFAAIENHVIRRGVQMNMAHAANAVQKRDHIGEVDVLIEVHVLEGKEVRESLLDTPAHRVLGLARPQVDVRVDVDGAVYRVVEFEFDRDDLPRETFVVNTSKSEGI